MTTPTKKFLGWRLFDAIVDQAPLKKQSPWHAGIFHPDYDTLTRLLAVPVYLQATSQSGVPALALDVWVAYELRRACFDPDKVWPRATEPRVLPAEIAKILAKGVVNQQLRDALQKKMQSGLGGAVSANAHLLGKNYVKQVDVVISAWHTGPELMISTKRMDSSFGKNAANRVEESYGDAKNLRLRHPQAALGFLYSLNTLAFTTEADRAAWLVDLLTKLGQEDDAYDAVALVVPQWDGDSLEDNGEEEVDPLEISESGEVAEDSNNEEYAGISESKLTIREELALLPSVYLNRQHVPPELDPGRFFTVMVDRILRGSPINFHQEARHCRTTGSEWALLPHTSQ